MTGRKKMTRVSNLPRKGWLSMTATNRLNMTMIGTLRSTRTISSNRTRTKFSCTKRARR